MEAAPLCRHGTYRLLRKAPPKRLGGRGTGAGASNARTRAALEERHFRRALLQACEGGQKEATLLFFQRMRERGMPVTEAAVHSGLAACARKGRCEVAVELLALVPDVLGISPSLRAHTACITACYKAPADVPRALEVLENLRCSGLPLDNVACVAGATALGRAGLWAESLELVREDAPVEVVNAGIAACEESGRWREAVKLLEDLRLRRAADAISYGSAVSACAKAGQAAVALALLEDAPLSEVTYGAAISACEKGGRPSDALRLLSEMGASSLPLTTPAFNSALAACSGQGWWQEACDLVREMAGTSVVRTRVTCNALVQACEAAGEFSAAAEALARYFPVIEDHEVQPSNPASAGLLTRSLREAVATRIERGRLKPAWPRAGATLQGAVCRPRASCIQEVSSRDILMTKEASVAVANAECHPAFEAAVLRWTAEHPSSSDEEQQVLHMTTLLKAAARALWPKACVHAYGSAAEGSALPGSDVDFTVLADEALLCAAMDCELKGRPLRDQALRCLRSAISLHQTSIVVVDLVLGAREPVLRLQDRLYGRAMDVTINGYHVIRKSDLLRRYLRDQNVREVTRLVKAWAKRRGFYGYQQHHHLTGYGYTLLVVYFFQRCHGLSALPVLGVNDTNGGSMAGGDTDTALPRLPASGAVEGGCLSQLFIEFCAFYLALRRSHRNWRVRIRPALGGLTYESFLDQPRLAVLSIEDPVEPEVDVGLVHMTPVTTRDLFAGFQRVLEDAEAGLDPLR